MKTYVLIIDIANMVCGGFIYCANKLNHYKKLGYNVIILPANKGKVYIKDFEEYSNKCYDFIHIMPNELPKRKVNRLVNKLAKAIPKSEEIIIETGTVFTSLWGELLAKKLNAKHVVLFEDEINPMIDSEVFKFYKFKIDRKEFAGINKNAVEKMFSPFFDKASEIPTLSFFCSNSVRKTDYSLLKLTNADYNIGSIGRLEKPFVLSVVKSAVNFARQNPDKTFNLVLFGGADSRAIIKKYENIVKAQNNIKLVITGYAWPIPQDDLLKIDVFFSASGSCRSSAKLNIPTIAIDVYSFLPMGFVVDLSNNFQNPFNGTSIEDYLQEVLIDKFKPQIFEEYDEDKIIEDKMNGHVEFVNNNCKKDYFDVLTIAVDKKRKIKKFLRGIFGYKFYNFINGIYNKIKWTIKRKKV